MYKTAISFDRYPKDVKFNAAGIKEMKSIPGCTISMLANLLVAAFAI
jgi:hypothetical protein